MPDDFKLAAVPDFENVNAKLVQQLTLRGQEVINLKISDIDFKRMTIHISQSKYKKDRIIPLSPTMVIGLKKYLKAKNPHIWLFNGKQPGRKYSIRGLSWVMRKNLKKIPLPKKLTFIHFAINACYP